MKISRELVANVNFITATRIKDPAEFTLPKYQRIKTAGHTWPALYLSERNQAAR